MSRTIKVVALLSAGVIALGGISAGCGSEPKMFNPDTAEPAPAGESEGQAKAREYAVFRLEMDEFSRTELIEQLVYDGMSRDNATYAAETVNHPNLKE